MAAAAAVCACSPSGPSRATDSATSKPVATAQHGTTSTTSASAGTPAADTANTVTALGYGPLRVGMTVANAARALGSPIPSMAGLDTACAYVRIANAPAGMRVMFTSGTVARIEVDSNTIATGLGVRVGDSEARVRDLYGPLLTVQPHKYLPKGHYMIVTPTPASDSGLRLIFETDGSRVTTYRAGRMPQVEWVEGCA